MSRSTKTNRSCLHLLKRILMKKSYCLLHVKSFTVPYFLAFGINTKISSVIRQSQKVNLKTEEARKQSTPNFPKNERFLPPDTHTNVW